MINSRPPDELTPCTAAIVVLGRAFGSATGCLSGFNICLRSTFECQEQTCGWEFLLHGIDEAFRMFGCFEFFVEGEQVSVREVDRGARVKGGSDFAVEARERIESLAPGVVFLDIQMPGGTGFDLLAQLDLAPRIIFTTAYDRYAAAAFDVNALDYLLKPIPNSTYLD